MCFGARWKNGKYVKFRSVHTYGKQAMLNKIHELFDEADATVGWNSAAFDRKHLNREWLEAGMKPPSPSREVDLYKIVKAQFKFPSNKLDYVAQQLGVGAKVAHSGFDLWLGCMAGDERAWKKMREYQIQDVNLLVELYDKLKPWMKWHPDKNVIDGFDYLCSICGGDLVKSGVYHTTTATYQKYHCKDCGKYHREAKSTRRTSVRPI